LPRLIDFYEEHRAHHDKFEILAFHDASAKNFGELDPKLVEIRAKLWNGRELPFPILLDASGATIKAFGINSFPTTILINPEGKLVGQMADAELEKHLPAVPMAERLNRALDRVNALGFSETPLDKAFTYLSRVSRIQIRFRQADLDRLHIKPDTLVPLNLSAAITLRAWLDLVLEPFGLTYEPDDKGLIIVALASQRVRQPSEFQRAIAKRIEAALDKKIDFDFKNRPLADVAAYYLSGTVGEAFVLDPTARRAGQLNPQMTVTGSAHGESAREALRKLLEPLGLRFVVKDEVIVIGPKEKRSAAK
jgi:hypothetical protein